MNPKHILGIVVILAIGYLVGVKFPAFGQSAISKVSATV